MGYKKILVALDLTDEAAEVLGTAVETAKLSGASLSVVTVIRPLARVYGGLELAPVSVGASNFENEAIDQAKKQIGQLIDDNNVEAEDVHILLGSPAVEIRQLAEATESDLIVIGTHGRHGLGLLMGSTANAVLHGVKCDVLAVRVHPVDYAA